MSRKLGWKGKMYVGTAGTVPTPPTGLVDKIGDATLDLSDSEVEATTRASNGYEEFLAGMRGVKIEIDIPTDKDDTMYVTLRTAYLAKTPISLLMLDEADGEGPDGDVQVFAFGRDEQKNGQVVNKVVFRPTPSTRPFDYHIPV